MTLPLTLVSTRNVCLSCPPPGRFFASLRMAASLRMTASLRTTTSFRMTTSLRISTLFRMAALFRMTVHLTHPHWGPVFVDDFNLRTDLSTGV